MLLSWGMKQLYEKNNQVQRPPRIPQLSICSDILQEDQPLRLQLGGRCEEAKKLSEREAARLRLISVLTPHPHPSNYPIFFFKKNPTHIFCIAPDLSAFNSNPISISKFLGGRCHLILEGIILLNNTIRQ